MDHVAIMNKSWGLLPMILSGKKKIESRWYKNKVAPWGKIQPGDTIYFKNSGELITVKADVIKVLSFDNLNPVRVEKILNEYGKDDGIEKKDLENYFNLFKNKKYCLLIFIDKPQIIPPFEINKKGFGAMVAWICTENIDRLIKMI
jgi:ASC-1-like (ASCH) protein